MSSGDISSPSTPTAVYVAVLIPSGAFVVGLIILGIVLLHCWCNGSLKGQAQVPPDPEDPPETAFPTLILRYYYYELHTATNGFNKQLGSGAFGTVYEGVLRDGSKVAVKNLNKGKGGDHQDFRNEVCTLGSAHHHNLVRLRGFCAEGPHRLLVYDYMSGGSLDAWLFAPRKVSQAGEAPLLLSWKTRMDIALGSAKGLAYLHEECPHKIIHLDIKPPNILLDNDFNPKVADFGLAKLLDRGDSGVVTNVQGTIGYMAPEWLVDCSATTKMDVFSFGMVLLELISGRRNIDHAFLNSDNRFYFPSWAVLQVDQGKDGDLVDARLQGQFDEAQAKLMLQIAFWCIHFDPHARPSMSSVIQMMEERVPVPRAPALQLYPALRVRGLSSETSFNSTAPASE